MKNDEKATRLFYAPAAAELWAGSGAGGCVALPQAEARHAVRVLRLSVGDTVRLLDGQGVFYDARIEQCDAKRVEVALLSAVVDATDSAPPLQMLVGALKGKSKTDLVVRQAVELGVSEIVFFQAEHSVGKVAPDRHGGRWEQVVVAASKQCGRARLMRVFECASFSEALGRVSADAARVVFHEASDTNTAFPDLGQAKAICGLVGPEGGLSPDETDAASSVGFQIASLGSLVLRAETAVVAAATRLLVAVGRIP